MGPKKCQDMLTFSFKIFFREIIWMGYVNENLMAIKKGLDIFLEINSFKILFQKTFEWKI